jgi:CRP/FNR family transcriptional regulator
MLSLPSGTVVFDERQPCRGFPFVSMARSASPSSAPAARTAAVPRAGRRELHHHSSCLLGHADYNARGTAEGATTLALLPRPLFDEMLGRAGCFAISSSRCFPSAWPN